MWNFAHLFVQLQAVDVLITILQEQEQLEDSQLDDTYSTLPSASATPAHLSMPQEGATNQPQVPPIGEL